MDRLTDIALFLRVLDAGSISAAARLLDISAAVASKRLQRLEKELGVRLLHRTTRQLRPTPEGTLLAEKGRLLVEDLESLSTSLRRVGTGVSGTLRLTAAVSFGGLYIAPLLTRFLARHPNVQMSLSLSDEKVDLVRAGFDLAIRIGELGDSSLVARRLANNRRVLCASPAYLRAHGVPRTPADLQQHQCLKLLGAERQTETWRLKNEAGDEVAVRGSGKGRLEGNMGDTLRQASIDGLGISLHSTWHIAEDFRSGRLVHVLPEWSLVNGIYAVMPHRRLTPPRVGAFIEFLQEFFLSAAWRDTEPGTDTLPGR